MKLAARLTTRGRWAFIPGPSDQTRTPTRQWIREIVELPAAEVAASLLAFPGVHLAHPPQPDWWAWRARWEAGSDFIDLDFTLFDDLGEVWGGSELTADCPSATVLALLRHLNQRHRGIWLHDPDCDMHASDHLVIFLA